MPEPVSSIPGEPPAELLQSPSAVAHAVFHRLGQFAERGLVAVGNEQRVVAEAARAGLRPGDATLDRTVEGSEDLAALGNGDDTSKAGGARGASEIGIRELGEELDAIRGIGRVIARIA